MALYIQDTLLIQYSRSFEAPIAAGEVMGTVTYFPESGEPAVYDLVASRSVAVRDNVPKTLEEIVAEVYADPNPFPAFSAEILVIVFGPVLILGLIILLIIMLRRRLKVRGLKTPKTSRRYVK